MKSFFETLVKAIDWFNDFVGNWFCLIALVIMVNVVYEVFSRYVLNSPTIWATELNEHLLCAYAALSGGYAMLHKAHVNVEIVQERLSLRTQTILNIVTSLFGYAFVIVLIWMSWDNAMEAWEFSERSESLFAPPLFPVKVVIPIGGALLLLQMFAETVRNFQRLITGDYSIESSFVEKGGELSALEDELNELEEKGGAQ